MFQNQDVYSEASVSTETATVMSSTYGSPLTSQPLEEGHKSAGHQAMMSSTSGQPVHSPPQVERHKTTGHKVKIPSTLGGHQAVVRNSPELYAAHVARNESRKSLSSAKVHHMKDSLASSGNVGKNLPRNPVVSPEITTPAPARFVSTFTPCTSEVATRKPVKEHDPTLASLTVDTSPNSFMPMDEIDNSDKIPVDNETLSLNEHAQEMCIVTEETALASVKRLSLVCGYEQDPKLIGKRSPVHSSVWRNSDSKQDMSNLHVSSCMTAQVNSKEGQLNSDRRELILDRKLDEKQLNPGESQENLDKPSIQVPKSTAGNKLTNAQGHPSENSEISEYRFSSLRPETIEAIKIGNPGLVKSQLPSTTQNLSQAVEKCICIIDDQDTDTVQGTEKTKVAGGAKTSSEIAKPLLNTLHEMEEHLAVIDSELRVMCNKVTGKESQDASLQDTHNLNGEKIDVRLSNDKEITNEICGSSQTRKIVEEDYLTSTIMKDNKVENTCYPLNMKQATQANLPVKKSRSVLSSV